MRKKCIEKTDEDFKLNAQQILGLVLFPELTNETDKKNAFARNTHLQPNEPTELELQEKLQQSESILGSRIRSHANVFKKMNS